jgi:hypothetical protein
MAQGASRFGNYLGEGEALGLSIVGLAREILRPNASPLHNRDAPYSPSKSKACGGVPVMPGASVECPDLTKRLNYGLSNRKLIASAAISR